MKNILSLTTTGTRIDFAFYGIQSLLRQSLSPDEFVINLVENDFPKMSQRHDDFIKWLVQNSITINWTREIGPYKKLIPTLKIASDDDLVVTADDDVIYSHEWFDRLITLHQQNPQQIVCTRARKMKFNFLGKWMNYSEWPTINKIESGKFVIPVGVGGVVYKKELLNLDFLFDEKFEELSPKADDLWFKMASLLKKTDIVVNPKHFSNSYEIKHDQGLIHSNRIRYKTNNPISSTINKSYSRAMGKLGYPLSRNDVYWRKIFNYAQSNYGYDR